MTNPNQKPVTLLCRTHAKSVSQQLRKAHISLASAVIEIEQKAHQDAAINSLKISEKL